MSNEYIVYIVRKISISIKTFGDCYILVQKGIMLESKWLVLFLFTMNLGCSRAAPSSATGAKFRVSNIADGKSLGSKTQEN